MDLFVRADVNFVRVSVNYEKVQPNSATDFFHFYIFEHQDFTYDTCEIRQF